jgi:hypothetical protein
MNRHEATGTSPKRQLHCVNQEVCLGSTRAIFDLPAYLTKSIRKPETKTQDDAVYLVLSSEMKQLCGPIDGQTPS